MTDSDPFTELVEHLDEEEKAELEGMLADLHRDEEQAKHLSTSVEIRRKRLKEYHDAHPGEVIADYERGYVASFTDRSGPASIDLISMAKHPDAAVLIDLARAGLLSCNVTSLRRLAGKSDWADVTLKYLMPGASASVLKVERIEQ